MCIAAAIAGAGLIGGVASIAGSSSAAGAETTASNNSSAEQLAMFGVTQANEQPYVQAGNTALTSLLGGLGLGKGGTGTGALNAPFSGTPVNASAYTQPFSAANLDQTPGYQFTQQQGQQALLDQQSAVGGVGGNTLKALTAYNSGLADSTYQQQFQDYLTQNQQNYNIANTNYQQQFQDYLTQNQQQFNMLSGVAGLGQASAGNLAANSTQVGTNVGNNIVNAGNASAAGTIGATNAITGTVNNLSSNYLLSQLLNSGGGGGAYGIAGSDGIY